MRFDFISFVPRGFYLAVLAIVLVAPHSTSASADYTDQLEAARLSEDWAGLLRVLDEIPQDDRFRLSRAFKCYEVIGEAYRSHENSWVRSKHGRPEESLTDLLSSGDEWALRAMIELVRAPSGEYVGIGHWKEGYDAALEYARSLDDPARTREAIRRLFPLTEAQGSLDSPSKEHLRLAWDTYQESGADPQQILDLAEYILGVSRIDRQDPLFREIAEFAREHAREGPVLAAVHYREMSPNQDFRTGLRMREEAVLLAPDSRSRAVRDLKKQLREQRRTYLDWSLSPLVAPGVPPILFVRGANASSIEIEFLALEPSAGPDSKGLQTDWGGSRELAAFLTLAEDQAPIRHTVDLDVESGAEYSPISGLAYPFEIWPREIPLPPLPPGYYEARVRANPHFAEGLFASGIGWPREEQYSRGVWILCTGLVVQVEARPNTPTHVWVVRGEDGAPVPDAAVTVYAWRQENAEMRLLDPATYSEWWSEKFRRGQYGLRMESHRVASTTDRLGLATLPPLPIGYEVWNTVVEVNHEFVVTAPGGRWNFPTPWTTGRRYDFYQQPATVHAESTRVRKFRRFWDPDKKRLTHDLAATDSSSWAARLWPGDALDSFGSVVSMRQVADWNEDSRLKAGLRLLSSPSPVCGDSIRVKLELDSATPLSTDGYVRWTVYALDFEPTTARLPERERPWVRHGWERGQTYLQRRAKIEGAGTTFVFRTTGEEGNLSSPPILCTGTELNRIYEVRAYVQDGTGRTASLRLRIPVLDGNGSISAAELAPAQMHAPDRLLTLETEDLTLDGAELLNVSLRSALEDPLVLLELDGPLASHRRVLRLASGAAEVQLPITPGTRPRAIVRARTVHGFQLHHDSQLVDIPDPRLFLTVSAVFTQDAYSPGDKALLRIRCVDLLGRPVSIPLTVTVCGVVPDSGPDPAWSDPRRAFHGIESSAMGRSWIPSTGCLPASEFVTKATVQTRAGLESRDSAIRIREGYSRPRLPRLPALPTTPFDASRGLQPGSNSATIPKFNPNYVPSKTAGTPFWSTELHTDANGNLEVEVKLDRANTRWIAAVMAMDEETRTGLGTAVTTTRPE